MPNLKQFNDLEPNQKLDAISLESALLKEVGGREYHIYHEVGGDVIGFIYSGLNILCEEYPDGRWAFATNEDYKPMGVSSEVIEKHEYNYQKLKFIWGRLATTSHLNKHELLEYIKNFIK